MKDVAIFPSVIVRALVIEQLNPEQWHVVIQGHDVPAGSLEAQASGVASFAGAVADAVQTAPTHKPRPGTDALQGPVRKRFRRLVEDDACALAINSPVRADDHAEMLHAAPLNPFGFDMHKVTPCLAYET